MEKLYCLLCRKESDTSEYESCPHCGAMGKWARPVEDSAVDKELTPRKRSPKLTPEAKKRVVTAYRESDAFQASSMSHGGGRVIR